MLGVGTRASGRLVVTDPDVIENSNLNRQFLFREQHIRKPKSHVAGRAVVDMNPELEGRVEVHLLRVHEASEDVFSDAFFGAQVDVVSNALDNVRARLYVDGRCLANRRLLLEPGTLGPKGHLQVILPGLTETYASQADPEEENQDIPYCTLRMFPEETTHCVEWARDRFSKLFTKQPQLLAQILEADRVGSSLDVQVLKSVDRLLRKRPRNFDDCVDFARRKFWKYFRLDALQLLHVYPRDLVGKDGKPFWSLPKRAPVPVEAFDPEDATHVAFVVSAASLRAHEFGIGVPAWTPEQRRAVAVRVAGAAVPAFVPSDAKAKAISTQVQKQLAGAGGETAESDGVQAPQADAAATPETLRASIQAVLSPGGEQRPESVVPEEFEKDNDANFHVDFVSSMTNMRARVYGLPALEWIQVKLKAGRIIPALVTTTAVVAGLAGIELCKHVAGCTVEEHRNTFLNMAVPYMAQSEPGPPKRWAVSETLRVSMWDRWEIMAHTLKDVKKTVEDTYGVR
jgi:molybdopterin/thiamine biosynthesis adenylyltransferase